MVHGKERAGVLEKITARRRSLGSASHPGRCRVERGREDLQYLPGVHETVLDTERSGEGAEELPLSCRKMELPAAGEHVFAVESIEKKRSRKVGDHKSVKGKFIQSKHAGCCSIVSMKNK